MHSTIWRSAVKHMDGRRERRAGEEGRGMRSEGEGGAM